MKVLRVLIFVVILGTVSGSLLVGINVYTSPVILRNEEFKLKSSVLSALEVPYVRPEVIRVFDKNVEVFKREGYTFYRSADGAVAFEFHGPGLWGPISGIISLEKDLKTIRRIEINHQEETPGLGGRIAEQAYLKQFKNKIILPRLIFMPEGEASKNNEVDAITGATGSSRAFERLINASIQQYLAVLK